MSAPGQLPYIFMSPDYVESSLGVQVIHRLCHMLNEAGQQAWLKKCTVNPQWNTPVMPYEQFVAHTDGGQPFIAVYPEVICGNPLNAPLSVRYMLNREGVIERNSINAGPDDLFFWYRREFAEKTANPQLLDIGLYDLELFKDDHPEKDLDLLYLNRVPEKNIDFSTLPPGIRVLSMRNPLSLAELATVLKRARTLYSYESSGTCALAILCGCPVIVRTAPGYEKYAISPEIMQDSGNAGFSWSEQPEDVAEVRQNLWKLREHLLLRRAKTAEQFSQFVALTQQKGQQAAARRMEKSSLLHWLSHRTQKQHVASLLSAKNTLPRLLVVITGGDAAAALLHDTLATLLLQLEQLPGSQILIVGESTFPHGAQVSCIPAESWMAEVNQRVRAEECDWVHCTQAGVRYFPDSLRLIAHRLDSHTDRHVLYADEYLQQADGSALPCFKPQFDQTLFFASPHRYCQRLFIRAAAFASVGGFNPETAEAFEFAMLVQLLETCGAGTLAHADEIMALLPANGGISSAPEEERHILQQYLLHQGYEQGGVSVTPGKPYRLIYGHPSVPRVSIILPSGNDAALLQRCITQLLEKVNWGNFELLVVSQRQNSPDMQQWLDGLAAIDPQQIRVLCGPSTAEPGEAINYAAAEASGEYLLLLDAHSAFVHDSWLTALMNHALRPEVGCVGPKFINFDQRIVAAGYITGFRGLLGRTGFGEPWESDGYWQFLQSDRACSALPSQCLMIRRSVWDRVGGFSAELNAPLIADVDLSLKVKQAGYLSIWTPWSIVATDHPQMIQHRDALPEGQQLHQLYQKWLPQLACDPAYPARLALRNLPFIAESTLQSSWQPLPQPVIPLIVGIIERTNASTLQLFATLEELAEEGRVNFICVQSVPWLTELMRLQPQAVILSGDISPLLAEQLLLLKQFTGCAVHLLPDAQMNVASGRIYSHSSLIDSWLVYSHAQHKWLSKRKRRAVLLPSTLNPRYWSQHERSDAETTLRVLCQTGLLTEAERQFMATVIEQTASDVAWIILGDCPRHWLPWVTVTHRAGRKEQRAAQLASLDVCLAVLPRLPGEESNGKSDLPLVELAASGIPLLCSDHPGLDNSIPAWRAGNSPQLWTRTLREREFGGQSLPQLSAALAEVDKADYFWTPAAIEWLLAELTAGATHCEDR